MNRQIRYTLIITILLLVAVSASVRAFSTDQNGITQRITFAAGATSAQVSGQVDGNNLDTYLLNALAGQQMQVFVSSPGNNVYLTVVSPGGSPLARAQAGAQAFTGMLPESGDYTFQVSAFSGTPLTTYVLSVSVTGGSVPQPGPTQRINFATGATSAQVTGQVAGFTVNYYLIGALAGQQIDVSVTSPGNNVYISFIAPSGAALARAQAGAKSYSGVAAESGDYTIRVSTSPGGANTTYTLNVSITGTPPPPGVRRITFATGANSAQVVGQINGSVTNSYIINALAGQRMRVTLISFNISSIYLTVVSPGGSPLARAQAGAQSFDQIVPETGDYSLQVSAPSGTPATNYALVVTITNGPPPDNTTERITFTPGTTSAIVTDQVDGTSLDTYLLKAYVGQQMQLVVSSPGANVFLTVVSPGGSPLARAQNGTQSFNQFLPETGDYTLQISAPSGTLQTTYSLTISVTGAIPPPPTPFPTAVPAQSAVQRIHFAHGAVSAQVSGPVDGNSLITYLLNASAGQRMTIQLTSPGGNVFLTVVSPGGSPLARASNGVTSFDQFLPESGDYTLQVSSPSGTPLTSYVLTVTVTGPVQPTPVPTSVSSVHRIHFATGATSAAVSGHVDGNSMVTYLLNASAGQRMTVALSSPGGNVFLTIVSPGGSPLARASNGVTSFDQFLPESGDYTLQVSSPSGTPLTSFTLTVSVV